MFTYGVENTLVLLIISVQCAAKTLGAANSGLREYAERTIPVSSSECHYLGKPPPLRKRAGFSPSPKFP